jgi:hypothetical protein
MWLVGMMISAGLIAGSLSVVYLRSQRPPARHGSRQKKIQTRSMLFGTILAQISSRPTYNRRSTFTSHEDPRELAHAVNPGNLGCLRSLFLGERLVYPSRLRQIRWASGFSSLYVLGSLPRRRFGN